MLERLHLGLCLLIEAMFLVHPSFRRDRPLRTRAERPFAVSAAGVPRARARSLRSPRTSSVRSRFCCSRWSSRSSICRSVPASPGAVWAMAVGKFADQPKTAAGRANRAEKIAEMLMQALEGQHDPPPLLRVLHTPHQRLFALIRRIDGVTNLPGFDPNRYGRGLATRRHQGHRTAASKAAPAKRCVRRRPRETVEAPERLRKLPSGVPCLCALSLLSRAR